MKITNFIVKFLKYMFILIIIIISTVPFLWVILSSFKSNIEILSSAFALPGHFNLENYVTAFTLAPLAKFYLNSITVAVFGTILNLLFLGMAAYAIARFDFTGKKVLMTMFSFCLLLPASALLIPIFLTMNKIGLYNSIPGLIIVYTGFGIPVTLYVMKSYFLTIPKELDESAAMDGAGFLRTFVQIIMPIAKPGFATAGILQFLLCWNEFQFALTLTTGNDARTLPLAFNYFISFFNTNYGAIFAAASVVIMPSILVYIILQEQVISGLAAGAVKG